MQHETRLAQTYRVNSRQEGDCQLYIL